jgi:hypothetical protein
VVSARPDLALWVVVVEALLAAVVGVSVSNARYVRTRGEARQRMQWFGLAVTLAVEVVLVAVALRIFLDWPHQLAEIATAATVLVPLSFVPCLFRRLDRSLGEHQRGGDPGVVLALRHLTQHLPLARREAGDGRFGRAGPAGDECVDNLGVDHRAALVDGDDGAAQLVQVGHALLQQVGAALRSSFEEAEGVGGLGVLAEHHHADVGMGLAECLRRADALVGAGRGMRMSVSTTSGVCSSTAARSESWSSQVATIWRSGSPSSSRATPSRTR